VRLGGAPRRVKETRSMAIKDIAGKLEDALGELITLEIITAVGAVQPSLRDESGKKKPIALDAGAKMIRTRIDLIRGDITTEIDPAFVSGDLTALWPFQEGREKQAMEMLRGNIEALKSLVLFIEGRVDRKG
jgi:hypothetical protein